MSSNRKPSRKELEKTLILKAWKDPEFKAQLEEDPKSVLEVIIGKELPEVVRVHVHIEDQNNIHLIIPARPNDTPHTDEALEILNTTGATSPGPSTPQSGLTNHTMCG